MVVEGLTSLQDMAGFKDALAAGSDVVKRPIHSQLLPLYARGLPPQSGITIARGWECISATSLLAMLDATRRFIHAMKP